MSIDVRTFLRCRRKDFSIDLLVIIPILVWSIIVLPVEASSFVKSKAARRFLADAAGTSAIEFAIVVIPFLGFVFVIFQFGLFFFSQQSLDYATRMASRNITTGVVQSKAMTADDFKTTMICPLLIVPIACSDITVNVTVVAKTSDSSAQTGIYALIQQSVPSLYPPRLDSSKISFCTGNPGDYVFVDVAYNFSKFADFVSLIAGSLTTRDPLILRSTAFLVNEPYQGSGGSAATGC